MLTVICPIYNEERYISDCVESILRQDYDHGDMEVLFVDGMSTDETREILRTYIAQHPFIKLLDNVRRTVPYAMNIGIKAAKGDTILRLDAHAKYPTDYFSVLVRQLQALGADNVGALCRTLPAKETPRCRAIAAAMSSGFGTGCKVMHSVSTPERCIFGAGTIVTRNTPAKSYCIMSGTSVRILTENVMRDFEHDDIHET